MTRVANQSNEEELLSFALTTTTARVEERCRELRCGAADSLSDAQRAIKNRSLRVHRDAERGVMTITVELPLETGELVARAIDKARDDSLSNAEFADESFSARQADAMVSMAGTYLSGGEGRRNASDDYLVTIHVDQSALSEGRGRSGLPIESVKRLCCDGHTVVLVEDEDGEPLSIGRKTRTVSTSIKRALTARDKGCRFPGCHHTRFVDAHHVEHWSNGGETSLDNLLLLCSQHHKLIHEGGFSIERDYQNRWFFKRPDGKAVPENGYSMKDMIDEGISNDSNILSEPFNNPPRGGLVTNMEKLVSEPAPPVYLHQADIASRSFALRTAALASRA